VKIFCTIFPFVEPNENAYRMGRFIANYDFLKALLKYGNFDSYHLFCMNPVHMQSTVEQLSTDTDISDECKSKVQVFLYSSLKEKLATEHYHVCHLGGWGYFYSGMVQLRNHYALEAFPVTAVIHSLNDRSASVDSCKLVKAPLQSYDTIVCTSEAGREVMRKKLERVSLLEQCVPFNGLLEKIPLGVDVTTGQSLDREQCRQQFGIGTDDQVLLYLGRMSPVTKADLYPLLVVFNRLLQRQIKPLKLILAGGISEKELTLHRLMIEEFELQQQVLLLDNFDPKLKPLIYCAADICVAPSDNIQETFGLSIIEAMAYRLPVVASDLSGYKELVEHGVTGFRARTTWIDQFDLESMDEVVDTETLQLLLAQSMVIDLDEMEDFIDQLLQSATLRETMGIAGHKRAAQSYDWHVVVKQYETLWDGLKQQAVTTGVTNTSEALFSNDYLKTFSHYPSVIFSPNMVVSLTSEGQGALQTLQLPAMHVGCSMSLDMPWLSDALGHLATVSTAVSAQSLFDQFGDDASKGRFSLLWAAKYGLVRLTSI
jgi:glycosyltransferase involved in cell wall biosynthesis